MSVVGEGQVGGERNRPAPRVHSFTSLFEVRQPQCEERVGVRVLRVTGQCLPRGANDTRPVAVRRKSECRVKRRTRHHTIRRARK